MGKDLQKFKVLEEKVTSGRRRCDHTLIPSLSPEDSPLPPETLGLVQHSPTSSFRNQSELKVSQSSSFFMSKL